MTRAVPETVWATASQHAKLVHHDALQRDQLGGATSRRDAFTITWAKGGALGPIIRCRACEPGFNRYLADVYAPDPTPRALPGIVRHFEQAHDELIRPDEIYSASVQPAERKASWLAATPQTEPGIVCHRCPEGMNRIYVPPRPYGDARRLRHLLRSQAELRALTQPHYGEAQAAIVEAWDRGLGLHTNPRDAKAALAEARRKERGAEPDPLHGALATLLRQAVEGETGIAAAIEELAALARTDPVQFSVRVGSSIPSLRPYVGREDHDAFAARVAQFLLLPPGAQPTASERTLWRIWRRRRHAGSTA